MGFVSHDNPGRGAAGGSHEDYHHGRGVESGGASLALGALGLTLTSKTIYQNWGYLAFGEEADGDLENL